LKPTTNTEILDKLYQSVDLLMLTSIAEGLPLVLLEAISAGLPWVATPVGGITGVLGETKTGIVLDKLDFDKEDIEIALNDIQKIDKEKIKSVWQENFNREKVCKMHLEAFQGLLNE
jgi:glycosyltransferase involved in cell wall biosynthesis